MTRNQTNISGLKNENGYGCRTLLRSVTAAAIIALAAPVLSAASNASASTYVSPYLGSQLTAGEVMAPGQYLLSPSRNYELIMQQGDGNLVEYNTKTGAAVWDPPPGGLTPTSPGPAGHANSNANLQGNDGNFVIYAASGSPLWASYTNGHPGDVLKLQDDGNIVIYASSAPGTPALWATMSGATYMHGATTSGDGYSYGQCTYWAELEAANYIHQYPQIVHWAGDDAQYWGRDALDMGWRSVGSGPAVGSIIVFQKGVDGAGSAGHVGWVTAFYPSTGKVVFTQMDVPFGNSQVTTATITNGVGNPGIQYIYLNP